MPGGEDEDASGATRPADRYGAYETFARVLFAVAAVVLVLSVIGAISIGTSSASLGLGTIEEQGRSEVALLTFVLGAASAAVIAGLGAAIRLLVEIARGRG